MPATAVVSVKVLLVMAGEAGVISVEAEPMPRNTLYRTAPVEAVQTSFTPVVLPPSEAAKPVGVVALTSR